MKKTLLLFLSLCISLYANAQATDLVVDCQTPGWLSSKINYGDQQTLRNLKVTGYINKDDLKFIGQLIEINLNGHIDLSDVNVVDNSMWNNPFSVDKNIQRLDLPKSVTYYSKCLYNNSKVLYVDTLAFEPNDISYVNADLFDKRQYGKAIKNLIVGEKVDSIPIEAFFEYDAIESVTFRGKIRYIGDRAFRVNPNLAKINLEAFDSLEYLGSVRFGVVQWVDTLYQPKKITEFPLTSFPFKENAHVFFETTLKRLLGDSYIESLNLHFKNLVPPSCNFKMDKTMTLFVPHGAKEAFQNDDNFRRATIIEENPVTGVNLNDHAITMNTGEKHTLSVVLTPEDADDKTISWESSNDSIASVDVNGIVSALKAGEVWIKAMSVDNPEAKDSCKVLVIQPVTGISLSQESFRLSNIGENIQLEATVLPADATNKEVNWKSTNEAVCVVANGKVIATGFGTAVILATTVDGGFIASCTIIVEKEKVPVTSIVLSQTSANILKGTTLQLTATAQPADATNKTLVWRSSDENVCVTTQTGLLIAMNEGAAVVTVVPEYGVGQAQCNVTVQSEMGAIQDVCADDMHDTPCYDMMGRKVSRLVKGRMYISNGKKIVAK